MKMKRGTDHCWTIRRYIGDIAWYAGCKCGYEFVCSTNERNEDGSWSAKQKISHLFRYCPICGARKKQYYPVVKVERMR